MATFVQLKSGVVIPEADYAEMRLDKAPSMMEVAAAGGMRDITRGFIPDNLIMPAGDSVLATRGGGDLSIYDDIARDDQVKTCRQQRELALIAKEWMVEPGDSSRKAKKAADRLEATLKNLEWDAKTQKMLSAVLYGYAVGEVMWQTDGLEIAIADIKVRNRRRFGFLPSGELRMKTIDNVSEGEALPAGKFWAFACGADHDDEPYGLGLGHYLYWPVLFKKNGIRFWLQFLEKFGQPTAVGKYPAGASEPEKRRLLQALASIQSSTAIRIPDGMVVELLEATRSGTADYTALYDRMNAAISKVYLGHSAGADSTAGKLGGEDNAGNVREDLIRADADLICGSFNRTVARWQTYYNDGPDVAPPRVFRKVEPPEDLKASAERDKVLFDMGFKPSLTYITETYGEGYEETQPPEPNTSRNMDVQTGQDAQLPRLPGQVDNPAQFAEGDAVIDPPGAMVDLMEKAAQPAIDTLLASVKAMLETADDFQDAQRKLALMFGELDTAALADVLANGILAANLAGRDDIADGR